MLGRGIRSELCVLTVPRGPPTCPSPASSAVSLLSWPWAESPAGVTVSSLLFPPLGSSSRRSHTLRQISLPGIPRFIARFFLSLTAGQSHCREFPPCGPRVGGLHDSFTGHRALASTARCLRCSASCNSFLIVLQHVTNRNKDFTAQPLLQLDVTM